MLEKQHLNSEEISLKELFNKINEFLIFLRTQWLKILLIGFIGSCAGFVYALLKPINFIARITFVVEEGKTNSSSLGGLASLAGQFGVDVGGNSGGGLLSGDNILLYLKNNNFKGRDISRHRNIKKIRN